MRNSVQIVVVVKGHLNHRAYLECVLNRDFIRYLKEIPRLVRFVDKEIIGCYFYML